MPHESYPQLDIAGNTDERPDYGAGEQHDTSKLFEPAPAPMPGQTALELAAPTLEVFSAGPYYFVGIAGPAGARRVSQYHGTRAAAERELDA